MAAHPKNKITRVEQGKRRKGNTPKLKKDAKMSHVPLHKRGFFQNMMEKLGVSASTKPTGKSAKKTTKEEKKKSAHGTASAMTSTTAMTSQAASKAVQPAPVKKVRSTQHKGG